jgi:hypothetical protein
MLSQRPVNKLQSGIEARIEALRQCQTSCSGEIAFATMIDTAHPHPDVEETSIHPEGDVVFICSRDNSQQM